jgi:hypothetical protein
LPSLRRGEQEQSFDHQQQAQGGEQFVHLGERYPLDTIPTQPSP